MKRDNKKDYFTAGELAKLFNISKQTLLYYDKIHLLSPDYIGSNGYRHYSVQQYLDLEIIVNLRNLNIGIADIKNFLDNRCKKEFLHVIDKKRSECEEIIKENERVIRILDNVTNNLSMYDNIIMNQPLLCSHKTRLLRITPLSDKDNSKKRIIQFTNHTQKTFHNHWALEKRVGWSIEQHDFLNEPKASKSTSYFSFIFNSPQHKCSVTLELPAGLYLEYYFKGTYCQNSTSISQELQKFLKINGFRILGDIYVLPIENHWLNKNSDEYFNMIFMRIDKVKITD